VIQDGWHKAVVFEIDLVVVVATEQQAVVVFQVAVVVVIHGVAVTLQQVSENVDSVLVLQADLVAVFGENEALIDSPVETVFEVLGDLDQSHVVLFLQVVVVLTVRHLKSIGVTEVGIGTVVDDSIDSLVLNIIETVALTFQVETGQKLLHLVDVSFTATVDLVLKIIVVEVSSYLVESFLIVNVLVHLVVVNDS